MPAGVSSASRVAAAPVSASVGWPEGRLVHPQVGQEHAAAEAGAQRLGTGLLGGEALGVGAGPVGPRAPLGPAPLVLREHALQEAVAEPLQRALDPADVADVGADAEDHPRARST